MAPEQFRNPTRLEAGINLDVFLMPIDQNEQLL